MRTCRLRLNYFSAHVLVTFIAAYLGASGVCFYATRDKNVISLRTELEGKAPNGHARPRNLDADLISVCFDTPVVLFCFLGRLPSYRVHRSAQVLLAIDKEYPNTLFKILNWFNCRPLSSFYMTLILSRRVVKFTTFQKPQMSLLS